MIKRLIILLLLVSGFLEMGLQAKHITMNEKPLTPIEQTENSLSETRNNYPQWEDLGLRNVLVAGNESATAATATPKAQHFNFSFKQVNEPWFVSSTHSTVSHTLLSRVIDYYVYCLLKLRL